MRCSTHAMIPRLLLPTLKPPMLRRVASIGLAIGAVAGLGAAAYKYLAYRARVHSPCVVLTDCEPDDELACAVLRAREFECRGLVVGEGRVRDKLARAQQYVEQLAWKSPFGNNTDVLPGLASSKLFPGEVVATDVAALDPPFDASKFLAALEAAGPSPTLICLKPPREILAALEQQPERARAVFARTTLAAYGSFNFRALGYSRTIPLIQSETTPFRRVYYYESHGNMVPNLNPVTAPNLKSWATRQWASFADAMHVTCAAWDAHILEDCNLSCREEEVAALAHGHNQLSARWERNDKCRREVAANKGYQFVPADPVLALVLFNPEFPATPMRVTHSGVDADYPAIHLLAPEEAAQCKTYTWKHLDGTAVIHALDRVLL